MPAKNAFYAQSGGVTSVINATACGLITTARQHPDKINHVFAGKNGILGALHEELIDTNLENDLAIETLRYTPGGAFGSCRYKLKSLEENKKEYERLIEVFKAHDIGYFFYNGGGDSQDTTHKIAQMSEKMNYPLTCIGIPKTVDNDLFVTDTCPGFGSVAKYVAISTMEAGFDVASMAKTSTKVFIMEVMGRHAGWIVAASGLAAREKNDPPHIILFPEVPFDEEKFLAKVKKCVADNEYCVIAVSEGLRNKAGKFITEAGTTDAFGHAQLGGVAPFIAELVKQKLGFKYHWAVADYLQRSARHIASNTDVEQAFSMGKAAVEYAINGESGIMVTITRLEDQPYKWEIGSVALAEVANREKKLPENFITEDGFGITENCRRYLQPLIQGEAYPPYDDNGLPKYARLQLSLVDKKLSAYMKD